MNASASLFEQHDFVYGDHRLAYETVGEGMPFVLLHGILLDSHINRELATRFAVEGYRVILLDLLGHGRSDKSSDPKDHRADFYADQVIGLLDHLGIEQAMVGGVSLGCIVSLHVAAKGWPAARLPPLTLSLLRSIEPRGLSRPRRSLQNFGSSHALRVHSTCAAKASWIS